jgi:thiopurine S-methyltransferase
MIDENQANLSSPITSFKLNSFFSFPSIDSLAMQKHDENSKNLKPWLNRWQAKRIGFHLPEVNPILVQYSSTMLSTENGNSQKCSALRVLVPLCGKTVDMAYLTSTAGEVVGVEGIKTALEEFVQEQPDLNIEFKGDSHKNGFEYFLGTDITLLKGNFFQLDTAKTFGAFDAIYDRASMVAIEPELRKSYVEVMGKLLVKGGNILLVALERISSLEEATKKGPPYSIPEATVRQLYESLDWVESVTVLQQEDKLNNNPKEQERYSDLDQLLETVYLINAKN